MSNLFLFWGQEDFLINSEIEEIKKKNIDKNFEAMAYKKIDKPDFANMTSAIAALPMMFGNVMHVINVYDILCSKKKSEQNSDDKNTDNAEENVTDENDDNENSETDGWDLKQLENALANKSDRNIVVLKAVIPFDSKRKIDTRKKIYKIIAKYAQEKQFPLYRTYDKKNLPGVIDNLGKKYKLKLSQPVKSTLIEQMGNSIGIPLSIVNSELEKLAITIYPNTEPTVSDIKNICTQKDDVFNILNAFFSDNFDKTLLELKETFEKKFHLEILGALQASLRNFLITKIYYPKIGKIELSRKLGIPDFIVEQNYALINQVPFDKLLKLKTNLLKTEYNIKTGISTNPEYEIEMALMGAKNV